MMPERDFVTLVNYIKTRGMDAVPLPIVAFINKRYYIVDGQSRINAASKVGLEMISCSIAEWITNYADLRSWSFRLNRHGYSNPLPLSDMINEDMKIGSSIENIALSYGVNVYYVKTLMKINHLHDDTKSLIQKILTTSNRKYQFLLDQITPAHFSSLVELEPQKQIEILDWIFHDVMYGPADESLISIPSIFEIINEIDKVKNDKEKKTYNKRNEKLNSQIHDILFTCKCGAKYEIDLKSNRLYEYLEQNNMLIKKEWEPQTSSKAYSSLKYRKEQLKKIIDKTDGDYEIKLVVSKMNTNENW